MNLRIHALKKASRQRPGVKTAAARFFSILYYPFCAKRSSFFQQNVQPRGNFFANRPIFVYFADILPRLTGAKWFVILLTIVPAGSRARAGSSLPLSPASIFFETDATKGSAFGMECRGRLLFILRLKMEGSL